MESNISDSRVFYVTMWNDQGNELYFAVNPVGLGISIIREKDHDEKGWGYCSWFDLLNQYMRTIVLKKPPEVFEDKIYTLLTSDGEIYKFELIDKQVFDSCLRDILPNAPIFQTDEEVQAYIKENA